MISKSAASCGFLIRLSLFVLLCTCCKLPDTDALAGDIQITQVVVNGRTHEIAAVTRDRLAPLKINSDPCEVRIHFAETNNDTRSASRLRCKLEGYDHAWQEKPGWVRIILHFLDRDGHLIGSREFTMAGETHGWRGNLETSDFVPKRETVTTPERAASLKVMFMSHGDESAIGLAGIDAFRVLKEKPGSAPPEICDLSITNGTDLTHPLGVPSNWQRDSSRADLAELRTRATPAPHPILALNDNDPRGYGVWTTKSRNSIPVTPGTRITLEWQTAHSVGGSVSWMAHYPRLGAGNYFFRVATLKPNGEPTGTELVLPLLVTTPVCRRWEFWLVLAALASTAAAWIGRLAFQKRTKKRLAELEREQAMERERERIARDLHDNLGAGLTEIAMQSDLINSDLDNGTSASTRQRVERIRQSATEMARSVDEIVWAVNPANDTLKRFTNYLAQCTAQFAEAAGLSIRFDIPQQLPDITLAGKARHCLFMSVREALTNTARHASAGIVRLTIHAGNGELKIQLDDDGCGFVPDQAPNTGNSDGLNNMRQRMEEIGGRFLLSSRPGQGTHIELLMPLSHGLVTPENLHNDQSSRC